MQDGNNPHVIYVHMQKLFDIRKKMEMEISNEIVIEHCCRTLHHLTRTFQNKMQVTTLSLSLRKYSG